jgi:hypothetical protein
MNLYALNRRTLFQAAGSLAGVGAASTSATSAATAPTPKGSPSDFDFLAGEWRIANRRLLPSGVWDSFPGEATVHRLLGGVASIEELRIPARQFAGMGLRLFDGGNVQWRDFWVNGKSGVLSPPGMPGAFVDGVGTFEADDKDGETPIKVRGVWDRITPTSCRWSQSVSRDGGQTWSLNWEMDWTRV